MAEAQMVEQQIKGLLEDKEHYNDFSILTKPGSNSSDNTEKDKLKSARTEVVAGRGQDVNRTMKTVTQDHLYPELVAKKVNKTYDNIKPVKLDDFDHDKT